LFVIMYLPTNICNLHILHFVNLKQHSLVGQVLYNNFEPRILVK
jgi:hypothetical protein